MPRLLDGTELYRYLTDISAYRIVGTNPGDTTLATSVTAGASTVSVGGTTSFTNGDPVFIIGSGGFELNEISGTVAAAMPMKYKVAIPQNAGGRFVEAVRTQLGHIDEDGPSVSATGSLTAIGSAIARGAIQFINQPGELGLDFGLLGWNNLNLQTWLGIPESESGAGTAADPWQIAALASAFATQGPQALRLTGVRHDAKNLLLDLLDVKIIPQGNVNLSGKARAALPCQVRYTGFISRIW